MSITWEEIKDARYKFKNNEKWFKVTNDEYKFQPCILSERYKNFVELVLKYQVNADDIWITTHPVSKSSYGVIHLLRRNVRGGGL